MNDNENQFKPELTEKRKRRSPKYKAQVLNLRGKIVAGATGAVMIIALLVGLLLWTLRGNLALQKDNQALRSGFDPALPTITIKGVKAH